MQKGSQAKTTTAEFRKEFDQVLGRHIERLVGSRYGIGGLPFNLINMSCFILLNEQINSEVENFSSASQRYTRDSLVNELLEIGLEPEEAVESAVQEFVAKNYVEIDGEGRLATKKPTLSMAQLLDGIFPKMPGMTLVAYIVQTMDEARSGRKDLKEALDQLDQTLQQQGLSVNGKKAQPGEKRDRSSSVEKQPRPSGGRPAGQNASRSRAAGVSKGAPPPARLPKKRATATRPGSPPEAKVLSSSGKALPFEIKEVKFGQKPVAPLEPSEEVPDAPLDELSPQEAEGSQTGSTAGETVEDGAGMPEPPAADAESRQKPEPEREPAETVRTETLVEKPEQSPPPASESSASPTPREDGEEAIDKLIDSFEEGLALQCPLCNAARIESSSTAKGKTYYKCSSQNCSFISWGKPYHLACPRCANPFLIELNNNPQAKVVKCPRATCGYRKNLDEEAPAPSQGKNKEVALSRRPRKKIVRKKLVRRKKS